MSTAISRVCAGHRYGHNTGHGGLKKPERRRFAGTHSRYREPREPADDRNTLLAADQPAAAGTASTVAVAYGDTAAEPADSKTVVPSRRSRSWARS